MPEIKEPIGNYWTNCKKSEQFKTEQPEQYKESLQLLAALQDVRAKKEELRDYERDLVEAIFKLMPQREMDVGGIGRITSTQAINRKWDHDSLVPVIVARALDDRKIDYETGEVLEREASAVARVMSECAGIGYWRLTALEEYGIDAEDFYETTSTRRSVRIQS